MARTEAPSPTRAGPEAPGLPSLALAAYVVLSCTTVSLVEGGPEGADYQLRWILLASDLGLGAVVALQLPELRALWRERSRHRCALAAGMLALSLVPGFLASPSARGGATMLRWASVVMVAFAVGRSQGRGLRLVVGTFAGATAFQVAVAVAERLNGGPVGLGGLGEPEAYEIGGRFASTGLTVHPYVFAAWCALGAAILLAAVARSGVRRGWLVAAAALPGAGVGLTMSRTGAVAIALVLGSFAMAALRRPTLRWAVVAAVAATAVGVFLNLSGWMNRASTTATGAASAAAVTSGRTELMDQASELFEDDPVLGVGPGRYVEELVRRPEVVELATQRPSRPVHLVPYLLLVEGGLVVVPALLLLAWAVARQTWRAGAVGAGVALAPLPFLLLDHLHWSLPQGLMLAALWLGALDQLAAGEASAK